MTPNNTNMTINGTLIPAATSPTHKLRCYALLRVSTCNQDVDRQQREIERMARKQGIEIIGWIRIEGVSGKDTLAHEDVKFVLAQISNPECDGLLVSEQSRLFRPTKPEHFGIGQVFQDFRKPIFSANESEGVIKLWTPEGFNQFIDTGRASFMEREKIRQRTMSGKVQAISDPYWMEKIGGMTPVMGSQVVYGYTLIARDRINDIPAHWVICEAEAAIVRIVYTWARQGIPCHTIAGMLNDQGTKTKRAGRIDRKARNGKDGRAKCAERVNDGRWTKQSIYQMLTKPHYTGAYTAYLGTENETVCRCPAIIDRELFEIVQIILSNNKRDKGGPDGTQHEWLLTKLGYCLFCGHRLMVHRSGTGKHGYYVCSHRSKPPVKCICTGPLPHIRQNVLELCVFETAWRGITEGDTLVRMIEATYVDAKADPQAIEEVERITALLAKLQRDEKQAWENLQDSDLPREKTKPAYKEAQVAVRNAEFRLAQAKMAAAPVIAERHDPVKVRALAERLKAAKPETFAEKRQWLRNFVDHFRTDGKVVEIEVNIPQEALGDSLSLIGKSDQHSAIRLTHSISFILNGTISA